MKGSYSAALRSPPSAASTHHISFAMASQRAMTDTEVAGELKKMETFITKEAEEKSKEIRLKADEEYEIEKASIVRSEINAIDSIYDAKFKKASLAQQITKSTIANKTRLKILATREEALESIMESAESELKKITSSKDKYAPILAGLIEESLYSLMEETVILKGRKADIEIIKSAAEEAAKKFEAKAGFAVTITVDETNFLNENISGGIVATNADGKIEVSNTLEDRLHILSETALPAVRLELFGPSKTRKFFD